jgi:putative transcriptional regulator
MPRITNGIHRLRFERGEMTPQVLAERADVTRQTIIALEAGKYTPSFRLAQAFQCKLEDVFQWESDA